LVAIFSSGQGERLSPFQGIRYNKEIAKNLGAVICPPYDVISPEQQGLYYDRSDYNIIRLEHPLAVSHDAAEQSDRSKYDRAAITFQQWLKRGILQVDRVPSFYLHDHYFTYMGVKRRRRGLVARVRLEPWGNGIYPHEETYSKAKTDRLQLMRTCQANFSPLFALYQDSEQEIAQALLEASQDEPIIELGDSNESHVVWAITDPKLRQRLSELSAVRPLYMADGHHRYETALAYQQERIQELPSVTGKEAFNYVMMTLVDFSDPGLVVFPIHRLVRDIAPSALAGLKSQLEDFFILESIPLPASPNASLSSLQAELASRSRGKQRSNPEEISSRVIIGILGLEPQSLIMLRQRQDVSIEDIMPKNRSQAYKKFDISLANHLILDRMLGIAQDSESLTYTVNIDEIYQQINEGEYQLAFILSPPSLEMIKDIVDAKDRMPRKSTYFYPKLPAGLIINALN
jgi:uncharacterized protein (DUF1015 family)